MAIVNLVFPDSRPLISLARENLLDSIFACKPSARVVITDSVKIEICRLKGNCPGDRRVCEWIEINETNRNIEIRVTDAGLGLAARLKLVEIGKKIQEYESIAKKLNPGATISANEASIIEATANVILNPEQEPSVIIVDDGYFAKGGIDVVPNGRLLSFRAFLDVIEAVKISNADYLWDMVSRRSIPFSEV